ncbi:hypothetical protein OH77DRAFT_1585003 [Trametes cingulata]|nr:hypothetical protein OH77DRAFT_1585003 [Trametes cingulata]
MATSPPPPSTLGQYSADSYAVYRSHKRKPSEGPATERTEKTRRTEAGHEASHLDSTPEMQITSSSSNVSSSKAPASPRRSHSIAIDIDNEHAPVSNAREHESSSQPPEITHQNVARIDKGKAPATKSTKSIADTFYTSMAHSRSPQSSSKYSGMCTTSHVRSNSDNPSEPSSRPTPTESRPDTTQPRRRRQTGRTSTYTHPGVSPAVPAALLTPFASSAVGGGECECTICVRALAKRLEAAEPFADQQAPPLGHSQPQMVPYTPPGLVPPWSVPFPRGLMDGPVLHGLCGPGVPPGLLYTGGGPALDIPGADGGAGGASMVPEGQGLPNTAAEFARLCAAYGREFKY